MAEEEITNEGEVDEEEIGISDKPATEAPVETGGEEDLAELPSSAVKPTPTYDGFLRQNITMLISNLKKAKISVSNFDEFSKEAMGSMKILNTIISKLSDEIIELRDKSLSPKLIAVKRVDKNMETIPNSIREILTLQSQLMNKYQEMGDLTFISYQLFYNYATKLEQALDETKGIKLSTEFLNRVESYAKDTLARTQTLVEKQIDMSDKYMTQMMTKVSERDELLKKLTESLNAIADKIQISKPKAVIPFEPQTPQSQISQPPQHPQVIPQPPSTISFDAGREEIINTLIQQGLESKRDGKNWGMTLAGKYAQLTKKGQQITPEEKLRIRRAIEEAGG